MAWGELRLGRDDQATPYEACAEQVKRLWEMTAQERCAAMYHGELTTIPLLAWAARCPQEVPLINGEFAFIAMHTPEVADLTR